jgi:SAM-dependent methyltransferase
MNLESFLFRLKKLTSSFLKNPLLFFKIFHYKKLLKMLYALSNVQVPFNDLKKDYQINTLFNTLKKMNLISDKNLTKNSFLIKETLIEDLEKKYLNNENCKKLKNLFNQYGSDKTRTLLVYIYFEIFNNFKINSLLEIGLGTNNIKVRSNMGLDGKPGASLRAFRDYLGIKIYGADVDKSILFEEKNIQTYFIDQLENKTIRNIKEYIPKLDLIIDDGLHQPDANLNVILELLDHLNPNGILVIEDIEPNFVHIFKIIEKIYNDSDYYKSSLIEMKNGYCLLIQNLRL